MVGGFFERNDAIAGLVFPLASRGCILFLVPGGRHAALVRERRQGTMELLLTMPITTWQAIVENSWPMALSRDCVAAHLSHRTDVITRQPDNGVILASLLR